MKRVDDNDDNDGGGGRKKARPIAEEDDDSLIIRLSIENNDDDEQEAMQREFLALFQRQRARCVETMRALFEYFPDLCYLVRDSEQLYLCCARAKLIDAIRADARFPNFVFTSFERALKHEGLEVTRSTHGSFSIKMWRMK